MRECATHISLCLDTSPPVEQQCDYGHVVEMCGLHEGCLAVLRVNEVMQVALS
jgi:hypothetical protein